MKIEVKWYHPRQQQIYIVRGQVRRRAIEVVSARPEDGNLKDTISGPAFMSQLLLGEQVDLNFVLVEKEWSLQTRLRRGKESRTRSRRSALG